VYDGDAVARFHGRVASLQNPAGQACQSEFQSP